MYTYHATPATNSSLAHIHVLTYTNAAAHADTKKQANQGWSTLVSSLRSLSSSVAVQSVRIGCHVLNRCWLRRDAKGYWSVCYYHKYKELLLKHGYIFNVLSFIDNKNESRRVSVLKHENCKRTATIVTQKNCSSKKHVHRKLVQNVK